MIGVSRHPVRMALRATRSQAIALAQRRGLAYFARHQVPVWAIPATTASARPSFPRVSPTLMISTVNARFLVELSVAAFVPRVRESM